jgi:hypothetical protein
MPQAPKCRTKTNLCQSKPKRQATQNERWLHLSSGEADLQVALQHALATISMLVSAMTHLLTLVLVCEDVANANNINYDALDAAFESIAFMLMAFLGLLRAVRIAEGLLFDIPAGQEDTPIQFLLAKGLHIDNLSDTAELKMTHFNWSQLRCLYTAFNLEVMLKPMQEKLSLPMGNAFNGAPCCYRIHPEKVFLFTLCRLATGMSQAHIVDTYMGGDKTCWTYAYP